MSKMDLQPISAVIITFNVADTIGACLAALRQVCREILVLDSFSDDGTVEICKEMGARVVPHQWLGFSQTKNLGNEMATHDWILSIDSDEVLSDELIATLRNLSPEEGKVYSLDRLTNYCGNWIRHSGWYPDWKVRLFNSKQVHWQGDFVHETLAIPSDFQELRLKGKLFHYSYKDSDDHLRRIEKYARLSAQEKFQKGEKPSWLKMYLSPLARFFKTYFLKMGFLDGRAGWIISTRNAYMIRLRYRMLNELWHDKKAAH
ncbi:MAG: glycosyltransferase family 2 protein [Lewinellaceae bacterium]|nr:glycosyltransferase family 2 protein [Saprospiraceae bacterium]MCB9340709.1 glycosyltransferase family 2 protein [Lewinellaceae bacterium]